MTMISQKAPFSCKYDKCYFVFRSEMNIAQHVVFCIIYRKSFWNDAYIYVSGDCIDGGDVMVVDYDEVSYFLQ